MTKLRKKSKNDMAAPTSQIFAEVRALIDRSRKNFVYAVNMEIFHTVCGKLERPNNAHGVCTIGATTTPTGLNIKARGCAYPRYPGYGCERIVNPNGVAHRRRVVGGKIMCNPVGVDVFFNCHPGVARIRATPGFDV